MRPDVKLGIVVMMVIVTVIGGYYLYRGRREAPILVDGLDAKGLVDNVKTRANKPNNKVSGNTKSASTKRQVAAPRDQKIGRRNAAHSPAKQRQAAASPSSVPTNQRQARRQPLTPPRSRKPTAVPESTKTQVADSVPSATRSIPTNHLASNKQANQPATSSRTTARKPVSLVATPKAIDRAALETHRVLPGETLASISEMYYGNAQLARLLLKANPSVANPRSLQVGMLIKIPAQDDDTTATRANKKASPASPTKKIAGKNYVVKSGDSLFVIAKRELGSGPRWKEIFELNKQALGNNPNRLKVGQTLVLPGS